MELKLPTPILQNDKINLCPQCAVAYSKVEEENFNRLHLDFWFNIIILRLRTI